MHEHSFCIASLVEYPEGDVEASMTGTNQGWHAREEKGSQGEGCMQLKELHLLSNETNLPDDPHHK